jgi:hypothetical protein
LLLPDASETVGWREEPIGRHHDRSSFDCGSSALNEYLPLVAGMRALGVAMEVGGVALAIDAKDTKAGQWYERFGAASLLDDPLKLVLPLTTIADATMARKK